MNLREQKILNAIKYFVKHTKHVGRTKLFKLLYFCDIAYFEKYGKTITGLKYFTYPFGPVPKDLYEQIKNDNPPEYFNNNINIIEDNEDDLDDGYKRFKVLLQNKKIDLDVFTPNEKKILDDIVFIFKDATASQMTEASHFHNSPWKITLDTKGLMEEIDFLLAKSQNTPFDDEEIKERMFLRENLTHNGYN